MRARSIRMIIALLAFAGLCTAEEATMEKSKDFSIRVSLGTTPGYDEFEIIGISESLDDEVGPRIEVLAVRRFFGSGGSSIGGVLGGGLFYSSHSGSDAVGDEVESSVFGAMLQGGLAVRAGRRVVFEFGPYLGVGVANTEITGYTDGTGPYVMAGLKGGAFVLLGNRMELGVEAGVEGIATMQEVTDSTGTDEIVFSGSNAHVAAVLAIPF